MLRFIGKRAVQMVALFIIYLSVLYILLHAQPGDISAQLVSNPNLPPEAREMVRARLGLDKPLWLQYLNYIKNFFTGNLGVSFSQYPRPVTKIILERLPRTIVLFLSATLVAYSIGFYLGKILAWKRGKASEYAVTVGGVMLYTVFYPWFGLMMIWLFAFIFGLFPVGKFIDPQEWFGSGFSVNRVFQLMMLTTLAASVVMFGITWASNRLRERRRRIILRRAGFAAVLVVFLGYWWTSPMRPFAGDILHHLILPVMTLALVVFGGVMLIMRSSMLETLREDYILTARAKGLPDSVVRDRHAARNALLPVVTSLVLALAFVIGGGIITEAVFSWPGMGEVLLNAALVEDIPLAIGALAFIGVLALVGHLVADILYTFLDPRIRYQG
ncbi:MAG: ABC transporter permease [Actinomycetota bacterium]|nr:ABC transporter permease [Actinomycetota bacterium]